MTKVSNIKKKFIKANEENYRLILNYRKSLLLKNKSTHTIENYSKDVYHLMIWLQDRDIKTIDLTLELFTEYMNTMDSVTAARRLKIVSGIKAFYQLLRERRTVKSNVIDAYDTTELRIKFNAEKMSKE